MACPHHGKRDFASDLQLSALILSTESQDQPFFTEKAIRIAVSPLLRGGQQLMREPRYSYGQLLESESSLRTD